MQCAKMQSTTKAVIVLDPSTSHLANAVQLNASASPAQILLLSGDSSIKESRQEGRRNKSSWIRRLKPPDELELSKGGLAEASSLDRINSEKGDSCERIDIGSGSVRPGCFQQDKAANGGRARPNRQAESGSDSKRQKMSEQKACDGGEKRTRDVCQEKTIMGEPGKSAMALPSNVGFGPWAGRKLDMKTESVLGSKNVVGNATTSRQEDIQGNFHTDFSLTNSVLTRSPLSMAGDVTAPAIFYKSPLSPVHSKLGLPPRPPSQKTPGFHPPSKVAPSSSGMGRVGFHPFAGDVQPNRQLFATPSNREAMRFVGVQDKGASEIAEAVKSESYFQKLNPSEQSLSDCGQQLFASSYTRMGNSNLPVRPARSSAAERASAYVANQQPIGSCSDGAAVQFENGRRGACEDLHTNISREGANLASDGVDLHLKVSVPGMEDSKAVLKNEPLLQTASIDPNKTPLQQSPSGSFLGTSTSSKADASASTSAGLPWEMFIEPAGASRTAREQFVEVYNRARDELKNQRMSQTMSRAWAREVDGGPKLTLGPGDAASEHLERQLLKHDQHLGGHSQAQWRRNVPSTNPEHTTLSLESSPKEQHSISLVESKGPVTTLAYEQSGLHGVLDTPWKQTDSFRREKMQPSSSINTVVHAGDHQIACQRLDERSVAHSKADKGQFFSSALAANTKELASRLDEGNGTRLSHQLDDRKESGKRAVEEHSISRVAEKGAVSRARPQSSPHVWLQRWHPAAAYNSKGLLDAQVPSDGKKIDSASYLACGLKKFKDGDGVGVFSRSKEFKNVSADKETGVKSLKTSPSKMLPSAAAMAIVGTAARQFCASQPQRKGSFAFWSGYVMPPPLKVEPVQQEKGKEKMFLKADANMPDC